MIPFKNKLMASWLEWLDDFEPFCATTLHFLEPATPSLRTDAGRARQIDRIKSEVGKHALSLDQTYFHTRHVGSRVAKYDRFDAVCVIEKLGDHPHVHLAWFPGRHRPVPMNPIEKLLRLCCILETFNRSARKLEAEDRQLLDQLRTRRDRFEPTAVANWEAKGWSVFSRSVYDSGWLEYILKEMEHAADFSDQIFFLSDLHSSKQRTKATRYYSVHEHTGAHVLDLDRPVVPKR